MHIHLLSVPYDSARRGERMGAGPERLLAAGAVRRLEQHGHRVDVAEIAPPDGAFPAEIRTAFELQRAVAAVVRRVSGNGSLPIVLSGNCNVAALGTLAGLRQRPLGVLWLDCHGDFNTPETTIGGFLDGMALAMATGRCWTQLLAQLPSFAPVEPANVVLIGARDLDPLEETLLAESPVAVVPPGDVGDRLVPALDSLRERVRDVYLHIDLDVLDPVAHGRANALAAPGGLALDDVRGAIRCAAERFRIRGGALTAYDPAFDDDGRVCAAAIELLATLAGAARAAAVGEPAAHARMDS